MNRKFNTIVTAQLDIIFARIDYLVDVKNKMLTVHKYILQTSNFKYLHQVLSNDYIKEKLILLNQFRQTIFFFFY
jgi:hypothetical protein